MYNSVSMMNTDDGFVVCCRTGLTVAEEGLFKGVPVSFGYNAAGYPLNVLTNCPTRLDPRAFAEPFVFLVEADGMNLCRGMSFLGFEKTEENGVVHAEIKYRSGVLPVDITEHTLTDSTAMFTRYLEIKNDSDRELRISRLVIHGGGVEHTEFNDCAWFGEEDFRDMYELGYFTDDEWAREGILQFGSLRAGTTVVNCGFGSQRFRHPAIFLKNRMSGVTYYVQTGHSAGVRYTVDLNAKEGNPHAYLSYSAEITGHAPLYCLGPGNALTTPEVHFCAVHGGFDEAVNEGIAHIRKSVLNNPDAPALLSVGAGMGAEHDMSVETSKIFAKQLRDMGADVFIIDAGWACPPSKETQWFDYNGVNVPDADRYPDGIGELRDYCHSIGMGFAMWAEPERLGKMAEMRKKHPEWFPEDIFGDSYGGFIDMTNPEAAEWAENEIARIVTEYGLDLLRIDCNVSGSEMFGFNGRECISLRHCEAVYAMYGRLKKRFLDVVFENCAGGGGRTDTAMLKNFNHTWVSDNQKMPRSVEITNGMTCVLPPERVDRLFAGMGCHATGDVRSHIRNAMLTHMSLNVISPACLGECSDSMGIVKRSVKIYKESIAPFLPVSKVYHHTPDRKTAAEKGYSALEVASPEKDRAALAVFALPFGGEKDVFITPRGISAEYEYSVYTDNDQVRYTAAGSEILSRGVRIRLSSALSSELVLLEKTV